MKNSTLWDASVEEIKNGYIYNKQEGIYVCLICGKTFDENEVFKTDNKFYNAKKYISIHIKNEHGSIFSYLTNLDKKHTGLTDTQKNIMQMLKKGMNDKEISKVCSCSNATIRNYRFQFREKEKQAKIQLAIYEILNNKNVNKSNIVPNDFIEFSPSVKIIDERFAITNKEYDEIIGIYITNGKLKQFPSKHKRKIIILKYISLLFQKTKKYKEKEVNNIISSIYDDYATIKRYLIDYGFMDREKDCSFYWIKNGGN